MTGGEEEEGNYNYIWHIGLMMNGDQGSAGDNTISDPANFVSQNQPSPAAQLYQREKVEAGKYWLGRDPAEIMRTT